MNKNFDFQSIAKQFCLYGDLVSVAISENPSYKARTGTVTIGTETFTVKISSLNNLFMSIELNCFTWLDTT